MNNILELKNKLLKDLVGLGRYPKRVFLLINDLILLFIAIWGAFSLRLGQLYWPESLEFGLLLASAPFIGISIFYYLGLYRLVTRFIGPQGAVRILAAVVLSVLAWSLIVILAAVPGLLPRSVFILYGLLAVVLVWGSRYVAGVLLRGLPFMTFARFEDAKKNILIYGAGQTGVELLQALRISNEYNAIAFIDDDDRLHNQNVSGLKVYPHQKLDKLIGRGDVDEVFLALSDQTIQARRAALKRLETFPVQVKTLPGLNDIASGKVRISDLRHVDVEDLLGRDPVPPHTDLLDRNIKGKSVLITGAGGSIGSELTRQIVDLGARRIVLFDLSEIALYDIEMEIRDHLQALAESKKRDVVGFKVGAFNPPIIKSVLGSVSDEPLIIKTLQDNDVHTIYHAAAYKHVPIVEANPVSGIMNNTFGTRIVAECALACDVEQFVLISTDKAVRPTNIMGASKRLSELVLQALADEGRSKTIFSMVRFGNVLDSSGSVVKRFRKQILEGGPVTVTHPDIIRYFMSIPEAAQLVIQAGAMGSGGDVFVLDMGEPVKIDNLARSMIRLMGREVIDENHPGGDIAIEYMGLRPGEKLYEELLIGDNSTGTAHPRILRNIEGKLSISVLDARLDILKRAMDGGNVADIHKLLSETVEGYTAEIHSFDDPVSGDENWADTTRTLH